MRYTTMPGDAAATSQELIIIARYGDDGHLVLRVTHQLPDHDDAMRVLRDTVREWGKTDAGREAVRFEGDDFDWGSLVLYDIPIPGVQVEPVGPQNVWIVDHDERLARL